MCEKFHQLLTVGQWFPPVSSTRNLISSSSSSFHRLDMTLAVAEALNPNKPNQTKPVSSTRKLISSSSFHHLDMTLAVAEALNPSKPNHHQKTSLPISIKYVTADWQSPLSHPIAWKRNVNCCPSLWTRSI